MKRIATITHILLHIISWIGLISAEWAVCTLLYIMLIDSPSEFFDSSTVLITLWFLSMALSGIYMGIVAFRYAYLHKSPKSPVKRDLQIIVAGLVLLVAFPSSLLWTLECVPVTRMGWLDILIFVDAWAIPIAIITICSYVIVQCSATLKTHKQKNI